MKLRIFSRVSLVCCLCVLAATVFGAEQKEVRSGSSREAEELLNRLGRKASDFTTFKTDFVQEKELQLFQDKLVLKGRIYLRKPGQIAWHVDHPMKYSVLITDKLIRQWDGETNRIQEISLAGNPAFQTVLGQVTVWFSGEYALLLKDYTVKVTQKEPVVLECSPRDASIVRNVIKTITLAFRDDQTYLRMIRILERTGDVTTINFLNPVMNPLLDNKSFEVHPAGEQGRVKSDPTVRNRETGSSR